MKGSARRESVWWISSSSGSSSCGSGSRGLAPPCDPLRSRRGGPPAAPGIVAWRCRYRGGAGRGGRSAARTGTGSGQSGARHRRGRRAAADPRRPLRPARAQRRARAARGGAPARADTADEGAGDRPQLPQPPRLGRGDGGRRTARAGAAGAVHQDAELRDRPRRGDRAASRRGSRRRGGRGRRRDRPPRTQHPRGARRGLHPRLHLRQRCLRAPLAARRPPVVARQVRRHLHRRRTVESPPTSIPRRSRLPCASTARRCSGRRRPT